MQKLSAVIFSDAYPLSFQKRDGRELKLVHNPYAENPIDRGLLRSGANIGLRDCKFSRELGMSTILVDHEWCN